MTVRRTLVYLEGKYSIGEPKTARGRRTVPLSPHVTEALGKHRERLVAAGFVPIATGPVFVNRKGHDLNRAVVSRHFHRLCERAGLQRAFRFHDMRATFVSRLHDAGVQDRIIADLAGHSKVHVTQDKYIATTPEQAVAAIGRLGR